MSHVLKEIPDIAARFRDDEAVAERLWDDGAVTVRLLDGNSFRHPHTLSVIPAKAGISLSSLARLIDLNKVSHVLKGIPDIAARFRDDDTVAARFRDDVAFAERFRDVGAVAARLLDGDTFCHPRALSVIPAKAGISLSSLATLIKDLNKVSHVLKEIPDIAARFRDDDTFRHSCESRNLLKQSG